MKEGWGTMGSKLMWLHIGMPKCGSTTLQNVLGSNPALLQSAGLSYPIVPNSPVNEGNGLLLLRAVLQQDWQALRDVLGTLAEGDADIVVSNEQLVLLYLARDNLRRVLGSFESHGLDVRVVLILRRQDAWIESDYNQHIKGHPEWTDSVQKLIAKRIGEGALDYERITSVWADAVGSTNLSVIPFRESWRHGELVQKFLAIIGLESKGLDFGDRRNVSPGRLEIEIARLAKKELLRVGVPWPDVAAFLSETILKAQSGAASRDRMPLLSPDERKVLVREFQRGNSAVARRFLGSEQLFDDDLLSEPDWEQVQPVTVESVLRLFYSSWSQRRATQ